MTHLPADPVKSNNKKNYKKVKKKIIITSVFGFPRAGRQSNRLCNVDLMKFYKKKENIQFLY